MNIKGDLFIGDSEAVGNSNTISGLNSFAQGANNTASGLNSHAEGGGFNTASGINSHVEGQSGNVSGRAAHGEGNAPTVSGFAAHGEGEGAIVAGYAAHGEGLSATASGDYSHAEGEASTASGIDSHAQGFNSIASGNTSFAAGTGALAAHDYSTVFADSLGATSTAINQMVASYTGNILLNPTSGNVGIGTTNPLDKLQVTGTSRFTDRVKIADGSFGSPAIQFINESNMGLMRKSGGVMAFVSNGQECATITGGSGVGAFAVGNTTPSVSRLLISNQGTPGGLTNAFSISSSTVDTGDVMSVKISTGFIGMGTNTPSEKLDISGNLRLRTAGNGIRIAEGTNARMGVATLVAGTVTVTNTSVTASTRIFLTVSTAGGVQGFLSTTQIATTSFTINSTNALDTSTVNWLLVEPA